MAGAHAYNHFVDKRVPKATAVCCRLQPKGREGQSKYTCQRSAIVLQRKEAGRQNGSGQELISRYCCSYSRRIRQIDRSVERNFFFSFPFASAFSFSRHELLYTTPECFSNSMACFLLHILPTSKKGTFSNLLPSTKVSFFPLAKYELRTSHLL